MPFEPNNLDSFLGQKLKFFRNQMNWPLKTLADQLQISLQQLQKYEQGSCKISAGLLFRLAHLFQISLDSFFEGYEHASLPPSSDLITASPDNKVYNVLVVEDNVDDEFLLRKALESFSLPLNIYSIHDGQKALDFFRTLHQNGITYLPRPDLIFLDLHLPSIKGLEVLKELKRRPALQNIPVIILTNSLSKRDMNDAYSYQASGFVRKSFCFEDFKEHLHQALTYWTQAVVLPQEA